MEGCTTSGVETESSLIASATKDELLVAEILLGLRNTMDIVQLLPGCKWAAKKRRSCCDDGEPSSSVAVGGEQKRPKAAENGGAAAASPNDVHFFPLSDEDTRRKCSKNKSKEEYIVQIEELTACRDALRTEVEKVKKYFNELESYNRYLKAIKKEVQNSCHKKDGSKVQIIQESSLGAAPHQLWSDPTRQPLFDPTAAQCNTSHYGFESVSNVGPLQLPDLNLSVEESFWLDPSLPLDGFDDRRAILAEARRARMVVMKNKFVRSGDKSSRRR